MSHKTFLFSRCDPTPELQTPSAHQHQELPLRSANRNRWQPLLLTILNRLHGLLARSNQEAIEEVVSCFPVVRGRSVPMSVTREALDCSWSGHRCRCRKSGELVSGASWSEWASRSFYNPENWRGRGKVHLLVLPVASTVLYTRSA